MRSSIDQTLSTRIRAAWWRYGQHDMQATDIDRTMKICRPGVRHPVKKSPYIHGCFVASFPPHCNVDPRASLFRRFMIQTYTESVPLIMENSLRNISRCTDIFTVQLAQTGSTRCWCIMLKLHWFDFTTNRTGGVWAIADGKKKWR